MQARGPMLAEGIFIPAAFCGIWHKTRSFMEAEKTDLVFRPWVLGQFIRKELDSVANSLILRTIRIFQVGGRQEDSQKHLVNL